MKIKKGFTMVELMVSIAIIAIVMVFLIQLLLDIRYDKTNELYDTANQINRAEIIKTIENDFLTSPLVSVDTNGSSTTHLIIHLKRQDNKTATIDIPDDSYISYTSCDGDARKWKIEKNNGETSVQKTKIPFHLIKGVNTTNSSGQTVVADTNDYTVIIDIPILVDKSELRVTNDSKMDNIVLTFSGYNSNSLTSIECLNPVNGNCK